MSPKRKRPPRPAAKDLRFPETLERLRLKKKFRHQVDFAVATGYDRKKKKGGIHPETIGHYERGEVPPSKGLVRYMAQELGLVEGTPEYVEFMAAFEHDRQLWDAAALAVQDQPATRRALATVISEPPPPEAARGADGRWYLILRNEELDDEEEEEEQQAAGVEDYATIIIPPPPRAPARPAALLPQRVPSSAKSEDGIATEPSDGAEILEGEWLEEEEDPVPTATPPHQVPRPPRHGRRRTWTLLGIVAMAAVIALILPLVIDVGQANLPNDHPRVVATLTRVVTAISTPMATPTQISTATAAAVSSQKPGGTLAFARTGPSNCDWNASINVWGFPPRVDLIYTAHEVGNDCSTGTPTGEQIGPAALCRTLDNGTCHADLPYSDSWTLALGSQAYDVTDNAGHEAWLIADNG